MTVVDQRLPRRGAALLRALQLAAPDYGDLAQLNEAEWRKLLRLCDSTQSTLLLRHLCRSRSAVPAWVRERLDRNFSDNRKRYHRLLAAVAEIADALWLRSVPFALLKGVAHWQYFTPDPLSRAQGDIDLWCQPNQLAAAKDVLVTLGYYPVGKSRGRHLDPMIREQHWQWCGNYFAPDLPIPVDLHYRLWDQATERIPGPNETSMWSRLVPYAVGDRQLPALHPVDAIAFCSLHLMMHVLHGDLRLERAWELAYCLHTTAANTPLWNSWKTWHEAETRRLQVIGFALVARWFGAGLPPVVREEAERLPRSVRRWIEWRGYSPIEALFAPNKDELWLHLALLSARNDRLHVLARRMAPLARPGQGTSQRPTVGLYWERLLHHACAFPITCIRGLMLHMLR